MQNLRSRATRRLAVPGAILAVLAGCQSAEAAGKAPLVQQMVVFKNGSSKLSRVRATGLKVRVHGRRRAVRSRTPLAALLRSRPGKVGLRSYGGQLYVRSIGADRAHGQSGWLYKVGNRLATAGASDPSGPFGSGLLSSGKRLTWYYGSLKGQSGPRTLTLRVGPGPAAATATAKVRSYDDEGRGRPEKGALVTVAGGGSATTGPDGSAVVAVTPGRRTLSATKSGLIRSFPATVSAG